ncbi:MAG: gliding motility-associated C-terminal domain-containing protein [Bacteroidia bacterium]|nr:gliding motility-associated C-terminal domain-containing protein [Bacteroidia bacterium]
MNKFLFYSLFLFLFSASSQAFSQGTSCNIADPFCSGVTYGFPMNTNNTAESGPNYSCLYTQPNPVWYYLLIDQSGNITINMSSPTGNDIDFTAWGPFNSMTGICSQLTATCSSCPNNTTDPSFYPGSAGGTTIDCSYDPAPVENIHISNAVTGQYYLLCITNYSNAAGDIVFSQSNFGASGAGSTDCSIVTPCGFTTATANPSACTPGTNEYSVSGSVSFHDAPLTGTMTISDNAGATQTINAPFTSPLNYNLTGLNSDGSVHTVTFIFSADAFCDYTTTYTAPGPCSACSANAGPDASVCGLSTNLAAVAAAGDYNLTWSGPAGVSFTPNNSATALVTATASGTYNLTWTITNSTGLTCSDVVAITFTENPTSTFTATSISCFGQNSTITFTGTAAPTSSFGWTFGGGTVVSGTGSGPYTVNWGTAGLQSITLQVSDNHCLSPLTTVQVNNPPQLNVNVSTSPVTCATGSNGTANVTTTGGTPAYTYTWSNGTGAPFPAGNYGVTVTDANLCTSTYPFTITAPNPIVVVPNQTNLNCFGNNTGTASVTVSGGTSPYIYNWTGGVSSIDVASGLSAGNYTVTILDANSCQVTNPFVITQPTQVNVAIVSTTNATCSGICNGMATVSANGGTPGYNYVWSNSAVLPSATSLCAGNYTVTAIDANLCTATNTVVITQPLSITASISNVINPQCFGVCSGSATVTAINGTGPYAYNWSSGSGLNVANNLCPGNYTVTASDANGCSTTTTTTIVQPAQLIATANNFIATNCYGSCDGSATITGSGGTPPYTYNWAAGTQNAQVNNTLCAGTHFVTVTDANYCTASTAAFISQPSQLTITGISKINASCYGMNDGSIDINIIGGIGYYTYSIGSQTDTIGNFGNLSAGLYNVTVTDLHGCSTVSASTITQPAQLVVSAITTHSICPGEWAYLSANASGGTPAYIYYWNGIASPPSIGVNPVTTTNYTVSVTDARGCTSNSVIVSVLVSLPLVVDVIASPTSICPGDTAQLSVSMTNGGGPPYMVYNTQGDILIPPVMISPATSGLQYLYVKDGCGSIAHDSVFITVNPSPIVSFVSDTVSGCEPLTVAFVPGSVQPGQVYLWNFGDASYNAISYDMNPVHEFTQDGTFDVSLTVTSPQGCSTTLINEQMISVWPAPDARFVATPAVASIIKPQIFFTNLSEFASTYIWSFGDGDSSSIENPMHWYPDLGNYLVHLVATTDKGCSDTVSSVILIRDEYTFYAPSAISPDFDEINDVFYVLGNGISTKDFHLYIFDRWGSVIYETDMYDPEQPAKYGWDGSANGGAIVPVGSYTWLVKYYDGDRIEHDRSGVVNVIR